MNMKSFIIFFILIKLGETKVVGQKFTFDSNVIQPIFDKVNTTNDINLQLSFVETSLKNIELKYSKNSTNYYKTLELLVYLKGLHGIPNVDLIEEKLNISNRIFGEKSTESAINRSIIINLKTDPTKPKANKNDILQYINMCFDNAEIFKEAIENDISFKETLAITLTQLGDLYIKLNNYDIAIDYYLRGIDVLEKANLYNSPSYLTTITLFSTLSKGNGKFEEAYLFLNSKRDLFDKVFGIKSEQKFILLKNLMEIYIEDYFPKVKNQVYEDMALSFELCKIIYKDKPLEIVRYLIDINFRYAIKGNFIYYAEYWILLANAIYEKEKKWNYYDIIKINEGFAQLYRIKNNKIEEIKSLKRCLGFINLQRFISDFNIKIQQRGIYSKLSLSYETVNKDSCINYFQKWIHVDEELYKNYGFDALSITYQMYAEYLKRKKNFSESKKYYNKQFEYLKKVGKGNNYEINNLNFSYGELLYLMNKEPEGIKIMKESVAFLENSNLIIDKNPTNSIYLSLTHKLWKSGKFNEALVYEKKHYEGIESIILNSMIGLTDEEQEQNKVNNSYLTSSTVSLSNISKHFHKIDDTLASYLFSRNLSLEYSMLMRNNMKSLPNELQNQYYRFQKNRDTLTHIFYQIADKNKYDSLSFVIKNQQKVIENDMLGWMTNYFPKYKPSIMQNYAKVKKLLSPQEVYISIKQVNTKPKNRYVILVVENGKENELISIIHKEIFEPSKKTFKIWSTFERIIKNKKTVYIELDEILSRVNFGLIKQPNGRMLMEDFDIRIVSSTNNFEELKGKRVFYNTALLVGNPSFGHKKEKVPEKKDEESFLNTSNFSAQVFNRGTINSLPYTQREVEHINKILTDKGFNTKVIVAEKASEVTIKNIESPRILHIATHGYFEPDIILEDTTKKEFLGIKKDILVQNPLLRSGLLLAGADNFLKIKQFNEKFDNGILKAYEVLNMNLENTELVVLSACDTGLGVIKNGEGVYGLQRAFKIAGARSILMSLSKVRDEATQILMTEFYKNWLEKGMEKYKALKEAQLSMKANSKYADPVNWGAFVLVE